MCVPYSIYSLYMAFELLTQKTRVFHVRFTAYLWLLSYVTQKRPTCITYSTYSPCIVFELLNSKNHNQLVPHTRFTTRFTMYRRLCDPRSLSGGQGKFSLPKFDFRTVELIIRRYTYYRYSKFKMRSLPAISFL